MDCLHEFYLQLVQNVSGWIQIRHWFDFGFYKFGDL